MNLSEKDLLLKRINELNIEHPRYKEIHEMLDSLRPNRGLGDYDYTPRHLLITGDSGVGKSRLVKKYAEANPGHTQVDEEGTEYEIKPVVFAEMPEPFTRAEFYQTIIRALGAPQIPGVRIGDVKRQAFTLIQQQQVEMLIFDEVNYILGSRFVKNEEAMEAIKHVSNIGNVCVVLVGTPESKALAEINFQYFRRFPKVELRRFNYCDEGFCQFLTEIEQFIAPPKPIRIGDQTLIIPQVLHRMSQGILGVLTPILQQTYQKILQRHEPEAMGDIKLFLDVLKEVQAMILGDDEKGFMKQLQKSESR
jgi:hypothetical protein